MASDLLGKIKETLVPSSTESQNTESQNSNSSSYNNTNSNSYNNVTENKSQQREYDLSSRTAARLESNNNHTQQNEGVRTGDRIDSMVENIPGVPSSSTQSKPTFDSPSYQNDMHGTSSSSTDHAPLDAARAPPSTMKQHLGEPSIEHDYPHESSTKRHSSVSHQEEHYNLG